MALPKFWLRKIFKKYVLIYLTFKTFKLKFEIKILLYNCEYTILAITFKKSACIFLGIK